MPWSSPGRVLRRAATRPPAQAGWAGAIANGTHKGHVVIEGVNIDPVGETADLYREFAEHEARGVSPRYEAFSLAVAGDADVLTFLEALPQAKRQPNLLFGAVKYMAGVLPDYEAFRAFVMSHIDELRTLMLARSTQTNEPGRCAVLLPLFASLKQPIALLEVGAAAGLCLLLDRYGYDYGGHRVGPADAPVVFPCEPQGPVPLPEKLPRIAWRQGLDLNPLDPADPETLCWLTALVWAGDEAREARLRGALALAATDPPPVAAGDLLEDTAGLATRAPAGAQLVVFHSAVMPYLEPAERSRFVHLVSGLPAVWISFEAWGVLPEIDARVRDAHKPSDGDFVLARDGEPVALANPHGRWVRWLSK